MKINENFDVRTRIFHKKQTTRIDVARTIRKIPEKEKCFLIGNVDSLRRL